MLNRVFKTIFILSLCLGITLPSNAGSVQVSDGSAFITKAEMAYQLNAISTRMSELENSLDSRIDTLVSSYLTRNGIWNGVNQTYLCTKGNYYTSTGSLNLNFVKPNKTGLLFTYIISNYQHALQCYLNYSPWPHHAGRDDYKGIAPVVNGNANIYVSIYSTSDSTNPIWNLTKIVTWAGQGDPDSAYASMTSNACDKKDINYVDTCMCFVNKDDTYYLHVELEQISQIHWFDHSDKKTGLSWAAATSGSRTEWNGSWYENGKKTWSFGSFYKYKIGIGNALMVY